MGKEDWYRRKTWTTLDQSEFFERLNRSRSAFHKAQYLRIQAYILHEAGLSKPALDLLDIVFERYPEDSELSSCYLQAAEARAHLGEIEAAVNAFRQSIAAQRNYPNSRNLCWLDYGYFVVEKNLTNLYSEVFAVFEEFVEEEGMMFASSGYKFFATLALIAASRGERVAARDMAVRALEMSEVKSSGFRYHPKVGLLRKTDFTLEEKLTRLARGTDEEISTKSKRFWNRFKDSES